MSIVAVYIDTSILLHYRLFDEIDWLDVTGSDQVELRVPSVILRELEKKKIEHPRQKIQERADKALSKLSRLSDKGLHAPVRDGVAVAFETQEPAIDYRERGLDPSVNDDVLLASALVFREEQPDEPVTLVVEDLSLKLKARTHGIETLSLPEEYKLPPATDAAQKEIRRLRRENEKLKNRVPELTLGFRENSEYASFQVQTRCDLDAEMVNRLMAEIKKKHPKQGYGDDRSSLDNMPKPMRDSFTTVTRSHIDQYNEKLDGFYKECESYIEDYRVYRQNMKRIVELNLVVSNHGSCPAENVDIILEFPPDLSLMAEEDVPSEPEEPVPPKHPRGVAQQIGGLTDVLTSLETTVGAEPIDLNTSGPDFDNTCSAGAEYHLQVVKHNRPEALPPVFASFETVEATHSFRFSYEIHAANVPQPTTGKLNVRVEKEDK